MGRFPKTYISRSARNDIRSIINLAGLCTTAFLLTGMALVLQAYGKDTIQLKVAAVQMRSSNLVKNNCQRITSYLDRLANENVQVVVFPECCLTSYDPLTIKDVLPSEVSAAEERIRRTCKRRRIGAVFGSVYKVNGRTYDTAVVFDSGGELIDRYGKIHLAGEEWATPGNHISYFELAGVPSTVMICHDERYPELARLPAIQGARVLYYISHESGLDHESKLAPYRAQLMARAVENGIFVVASNAPADPKNYSDCHGQSRIVQDDGNVMKEASIFGEDVLVETLSIRRERLDRPLHDLMGEWWQSGVTDMVKNRHRPLN